jgi:hypothetical protein
MPNNFKRKIEIFAAIALLLIVGCLLRSWQLEREARIRAEVTVKADETLVTEHADALDRQIAAINTPQQAVQVILHYLPPTPVVLGQPTPPAATIPSVSREALSAELQKELPASPSFSMLTPPQIEQIARDEIQCDKMTKLSEPHHRALSRFAVPLLPRPHPGEEKIIFYM